MTRDDIDAVIEVFTPDGTYSAFGDTYALADFPALVAAAPKGLFLTGTPVARARRRRRHRDGQQTLCFVDQTTHDMRIGYYTDSYRRTAQGWRLQTRSMTFLRRSGARDAGQGARPDPARALGRTRRLAAGRGGARTNSSRPSTTGWTRTRASSPARSRGSGRSTSRWPSCAR